jgi:hypothetical protein
MHEQQYGPWLIRWSDWQKPVNQHILVGYWYARRPDAPGTFVAATTMGNCRTYDRLHTIDFTLDRDWLLITPDSSPHERDDILGRAFRLLTETLDTL